ncbi:MAG: hypothetical protein IJI14_05925 [Anaerolineaceae bacterium]|nr:hypothetical protein [Anaerolineaceae bacterium]
MQGNTISADTGYKMLKSFASAAEISSLKEASLEIGLSGEEYDAVMRSNAGKFFAISDILFGLYPVTLVRIWNKYCRIMSAYDDLYYFMRDFSKIFYDTDPMLLAKSIYDSAKNDIFDPNEELFVFFRTDIEKMHIRSVSLSDAYENIVESPCFASLIDYMIENNNSFGIKRIRRILNETNGFVDSGPRNPAADRGKS